MKIYLMMFFVLFAIMQSQAQCGKKKSDKPTKDKQMVETEVKFKDLPDGAKLDDEVRVNELNDKGEIVSFKVITVEKKLREIGAKYIDNKLVDKDGKEIRFFKPQIRGTSEGFEEDQKHQQSEQKRLANLKEKYTVIEIFVNPLKIM